MCIMFAFSCFCYSRAMGGFLRGQKGVREREGREGRKCVCVMFYRVCIGVFVFRVFGHTGREKCVRVVF